MIEFNKIIIESQNEVQEEKNTESDLPVEILNEIQENLEPEMSLDSEQIETLNTNLVQETNRLIKEKELNDRLSGAIERHVIEDAKVIFNFKLFNY